MLTPGAPPLVLQAVRWRLQRLDRALDPLPNALPFGVAAIEHPVNHPSRLDNRVGTVAFDQQIGRPVDGDHSANSTGRRLLGQ